MILYIINFSYIYYFSGTNKSRFVIHAVCGEVVRVGRLKSSAIAFLRVGHSKTKIDRVFANITTTASPKDYFNHLYVVIWIID
jgi:hypothetical protein